MDVGVIGLGKLGLPVATAMAARGLRVHGYDPHVKDYPEDLSYEDGFDRCREVAGDRLHFCAGIEEVVQNAGVIFCAVQTPHEPRFEGVTPLPEERADFDYCFLREAARQINGAAERCNRFITLAVISTVLPGTMRTHVRPLLHSRVSLVYNPSFIAMGTTIRDFLDPEFVLLGGDDKGKVDEVYRKAEITRPSMAEHGGLTKAAPTYSTGIENAELIKVAYNTFIGLKLAFANTLMEVCHKTPGTDVDEVTGALKLAHRRLISGAYLDGGMGDGGGCHPRDNIALSWLARELDLSYDLFEAAMLQRERQAEWLADLMENQQTVRVGILGTAYKPGSHITTGSPALLVKSILEERGHKVHCFDPHAGPWPVHHPPGSMTWLVGCKHPELVDLKLREGNVVIDPWRYMPDQPGVEVIRLGAQDPTRLGVAAYDRAA